MNDLMETQKSMVAQYKSLGDELKTRLYDLTTYFNEITLRFLTIEVELFH